MINTPILRTLVTMALLSAVLAAGLPTADGADEEGLLTRAEASGFKETTLFTELLEFLHILDEKSDALRVEFFGESTEGRPLPLAILGSPPPESPAQIDRETHTVVFIQANIHAGEVAGKEACLMLMREIVEGECAHLLDNIVLLVAPDFNADGNERVSTKNRPRQNGPEGGVGIRANAQNLDLNRDFMKAESPEVAAHLSGVMLRWNPDVLVDCHTTNGSLHEEPICYAWTHSPLADRALLEFDRDVMMPWIVSDTRKRDGYAAIPYGYWADRRDRSKGWRSFGRQLRFGTNYWGMRNRHAILIEMYAYAPFETRVRACQAFLRSILEFSRLEGKEIRAIVRAADENGAAGERGPFHRQFEEKALEKPVTIMAIDRPRRGEEQPTAPQPKACTVPCLANYVAVGEGRSLPARGYVFPRGIIAVRDKLVQHGIRVEQIENELEAEISEFVIDEITPSKRPFQGHWTQTFTGKWVSGQKTIKAGSYFVPSTQPLGMLAACLLEPESDDSLAYWNFVDSHLVRNTFDSSLAPYPVWRWEDVAPEKPELPSREGIPVVVLEGTPAEIGAAMGPLLKDEVDSLWEKYMKPVSEVSGGPESLIEESLEMDAHLPERFREEMKAFAKAAGVSYGKIITTNAFPDIYRKGACSTFAASGAATKDGKPLLARNLDFFGNDVLEKTGVVFVIKPEGFRPFVSITWPGFSGVLSGMNSDGLCCAVMEVRLGKVTTDGMPSTLLFRRILEEASTVDEALAVLEKPEKVAGNNLIIIDRHGNAAVAELGPGLFRVRRAVDGMVYSTNHHRKDLPRILRCGRYKKFETFAEEKAGAIDPAALKEILHSVNQGMITLQSMIFEPAALRIHLATGVTPSSKGEYKLLDFSEDLKNK